MDPTPLLKMTKACIIADTSMQSRSDDNASAL